MKDIEQEIIVEKTGEIEKTSGLPLFRLKKTLSFKTEFGNINIPIGYKTDFASIPWYARWLYKVRDKHYAHAAILHDFLFQYQGGKKIENWNLPIFISYDSCNSLLRDYAIMGGTPKWKARLMRWAVQMYGKKVWNSHDNDKIVKI